MSHASLTAHKNVRNVTGMGRSGRGRTAPSLSLEATMLTFGPDESAILSPPRGADPGLVERAVRAFLGDFGAPPGVPAEFRPAPMADPLLGVAVLHATAHGTVIYCRREDLGTEAAGELSAVARRSAAILLGSATATSPPRARVAVIGHARWVSDRWAQPALHPLIARISSRASPPETTVFTCSCQMGEELADALTALLCTRLRCLHEQRTPRASMLRAATLAAARLPQCPTPRYS